MRNKANILLAGFGGQGVLFAGKVLSYTALLAGKEVSWLPSYGPEMRGGTANCSVCISDKPVGSPLVTNPDILIPMNLPSFDKFIGAVEKDGIVVVDSTLIQKESERDDLNIFYIPATEIAEKNNLKKLTNIILLSKTVNAASLFTKDQLIAGLKKSVPKRHERLLEPNINAIELGWNL